MMKKYIQTSLLVVLAIFAGCNAAEEEFNAPEGSQVTFSPESVAVQFGAPGEVIYIATVRVLIPIGEGVIPGAGGDIGAGAPEFEPGNKIQGVISCGACNLYVFKEGVETFLPQLSLLDPVAAGSFSFVTDRQGLYTFAFGMLGFFNGDGDIATYTSSVGASIRVATGELVYEVSPFE
jgi:hypothetical protein